MPVTYDRSSDLPQRSGSFQAMVRAGNSVTSYLRTGRGDPVVLLRRPRHEDALWGVLLAEVSHTFRAIVPEHSPTGAEFGEWFRSFLDGLGLGAVGVVSDAHFSMCCLDANLLDPDWLSTLVVVDSAASCAEVAAIFASTDTAIAARVQVSAIPSDDVDQHDVAVRAVQQLRDRGGTAN